MTDRNGRNEKKKKKEREQRLETLPMVRWMDIEGWAGHVAAASRCLCLHCLFH